jgi:hypothetical protein
LEFLKLQKTTFSNTTVFKSYKYVVQTLHGIMALQNPSIPQNHAIYINFKNTLVSKGHSSVRCCPFSGTLAGSAGGKAGRFRLIQ